MDQRWQGFWIRDWQPGDRLPAAAVVQAVLEEYDVGWEPERADKEVFEIETHYWQNDGEFWVIEQDGKIVGTAGYHPISRGEKAVEIRKVYLLPSVRSQGLGKYLMTSLEGAIAAKDYQQIWVETITRFQAARHIYESTGYEAATDIETKRCDLVFVKHINNSSEP
ncbi:GCN5-related N-acetyltransferase [[Leptolyngbya] sp. PCC 7376]|uniref:GNAT family N-acetyltransferase n=1 Tax=[Leptolyngbya] sp. PCC 7376 TaxID=111781 RepID=UPI00029F0305|nr:GNAT family N-acetyltransferase [[Leptolyngbya] sp. PCC 7376]AFY36487.1 GCN5-related N-acetyltransferase [[Leptolyngbya] sp. PCC 7376]